MSSLSATKSRFQNNKLQIAGKVIDSPAFYCESHGEKMYTFNLEVPRKSGAFDTLPVMIPSKYLQLTKPGLCVIIQGQVRSYSRFISEKRKLHIFAYCREMLLCSEAHMNQIPDCNIVTLSGVISNPPELRKTPRGKQICDLKMLIQRSQDRSDYIPAIAWARNAHILRRMEPKANVQVSGRLQSKEYTKTIDGVSVKKTAYEVSIADVSLI